jgi:hypothetical protein
LQQVLRILSSFTSPPPAFSSAHPEHIAYDTALLTSLAAGAAHLVLVLLTTTSIQHTP